MAVASLEFDGASDLPDAAADDQEGDSRDPFGHVAPLEPAAGSKCN